MDSLFAVKYNLSEKDPQKFGFSAEKAERSMTLYENNYALGLAFLTNDSLQRCQVQFHFNT